MNFAQVCFLLQEKKIESLYFETEDEESDSDDNNYRFSYRTNISFKYGESSYNITILYSLNETNLIVTWEHIKTVVSDITWFVDDNYDDQEFCYQNEVDMFFDVMCKKRITLNETDKKELKTIESAIQKKLKWEQKIIENRKDDATFNAEMLSW